MLKRIWGATIWEKIKDNVKAVMEKNVSEQVNMMAREWQRSRQQECMMTNRVKQAKTRKISQTRMSIDKEQ